jgi:hypothetical protein
MAINMVITGLGEFFDRGDMPLITVVLMNLATTTGCTYALPLLSGDTKQGITPSTAL